MKVKILFIFFLALGTWGRGKKKNRNKINSVTSILMLPDAVTDRVRLRLDRSLQRRWSSPCGLSPGAGPAQCHTLGIGSWRPFYFMENKMSLTPPSQEYLHVV